MMQRHGRTLLFHDRVIEQLQKLNAAVQRAQESDPQGFEPNASVKLLAGLEPGDARCRSNRPGAWRPPPGQHPGGPAHRYWRRAKPGRRLWLLLRYDSKARVIVYAWVNDEQTLRSSGGKSDPYAVFEKMPRRGHPPDDWQALKQASRQDWDESRTFVSRMTRT